MTPAFSFSGFLNESIIVWTDHPIYALLFAGACCVLAFRFAFFSGVRVTHQRDVLGQELDAIQRERDADARKRLTQINDYRRTGRS